MLHAFIPYKFQNIFLKNFSPLVKYLISRALAKSLWKSKAMIWWVGGSRQTIGEKGERGKKMAAVDSNAQRRLALNDILKQALH